MKLYEFGPTRALRVRWVLQELGVDFEPVQVNLRTGEHRGPEFLAINPAGKLPALVDGDVVLTESVAIALYLAEKHPEGGLLPAELAARAGDLVARGEVTLFIAPSTNAPAKMSEEAVRAEIATRRAAGLHLKEIARALAASSGWHARDVYRLGLTDDADE